MSERPSYEIGLDDTFNSRPPGDDFPPAPDLSQVPEIPPMVLPVTGPADAVTAGPAAAPIAPVPPMPPVPPMLPTGLVPPASGAFPASTAPVAFPPQSAPQPAGQPGVPVAAPSGVPIAAPVQAPAYPTGPVPSAAPAAVPLASPVAGMAAPTAPPVGGLPMPAAAMAPPTGAPITAAASVGPSELPPTAHPDILRALAAVAALNASDLHVSANAQPMVRVRGSLERWGNEVWSREKVAEVLLSLLAPDKRAVFEETFELDWSFALTEGVRFRANYYWQRGAIGAAFRIIPVEIRHIDTLGLPKSVKRFTELPRGLVLITGPTGSGKSTTLASLIDLVNTTRADHIMTVEDPIEFVHTNKSSLVNQREVGEDTHSFAAALKHVLRQDPDVILVGELRDLETIEVALTAAETGHLVYATLHTQSAPQTIDRVIGVFPPHQQEQIRAQLASTLQGVVCQTLVKTADGKGRVLVAEVMVTTPAISNLIREGKIHQIPTSMQVGGELGMQTLDQHLAALVNAGTITRAVAIEKVQDAEVFDRLVQGGRSALGGSGGIGGFDDFAAFGQPSGGLQR